MLAVGSLFFPARSVERLLRLRQQWMEGRAAACSARAARAHAHPLIIVDMETLMEAVTPCCLWYHNRKEDRHLRDGTNVGNRICFSLEDYCHEVTRVSSVLWNKWECLCIAMYLYPCSTLRGWQEPERLSLWDLCPPTASPALPLIISSFILSIGRDIYSRCSRGEMFGKLSAASFWACSAFIQWSEVTNSPWMVKAKRFFLKNN